MLSQQNSYGNPGGTSYGLFDNDEDMALNLGFSGFRRGYDFYKTDWKYLNDPTFRGGLSVFPDERRDAFLASTVPPSSLRPCSSCSIPNGIFFSIFIGDLLFVLLFILRDQNHLHFLFCFPDQRL